MSQENVEVVRRGFEAFNRGDWEGMVADIAPSFEYVPTGTVPGSRPVYRGPEGWIEWARLIWSEFANSRVQIREMTAAGDQVLSAVTLRGRGKQSGVETSWDTWVLWTLRDGKVVHGRGFLSEEEALEAAGLRE